MSKLYADAAKLLSPSLKASNSFTSIKSRIFSSKLPNKALLFLLVTETLKYRKLIDSIVSSCNINPITLSTNTALVYIYLFELLFSKTGKISGGGNLKKSLLELQSSLLEAKVYILKTTKIDLKPMKPSISRYVRVNELKTSVNEMIQAYPQAKVDEHVSNLLLFPSNADLHLDENVVNGNLILQDKSSCFPVEAIRMELEHNRPYLFKTYDAIDCCAAPGNKTSQLCTIMNHVYAFDKSSARFEVLKQRITQAGCSDICTCECNDFLKQISEDEKFHKVKVILLDPSCSGSGSFSPERLNEKPIKEEDERVERLSQFQLKCLLHAMSFEQVELIAYSTCSILYKENENVCYQALKLMNNEWALVPALPSWKRRGIYNQDVGLSEDDSEKVLRSDYHKGDQTGGFFLALFARKTSTRALKRRKIVVRDIVTKRVKRIIYV